MNHSWHATFYVTPRGLTTSLGPMTVADFHSRFVDMLTSLKASTTFHGNPVHLFWGSFDLAVTRFSGRSAPLHPGGIPHLPDDVTQEAYSHEVSSAGFWAGGGPVDDAAFYA